MMDFLLSRATYRTLMGSFQGFLADFYALALSFSYGATSKGMLVTRC